MRKLGSVKLKGRFWAEQYDKQGELKDWEFVQNTVTDDGLGAVSGLINNQVSNHFQWLAVGDSGTSIGSGNTALNSELTSPSKLDRASATTSRVTTSVKSDTARLVHTFENDSSNQITVQETGIFDTSSETSGTLLAAQTFSDKNLSSSDTLKITYDIQVS